MFNHLSRNKKLALQIVFWSIYYLLFSLIWARDGNYKDSFYLEFLLLPIRILTVYVTLLFLIPNYLLQKRFKQFVLFYLISLLIAGVLQQLFIHFFYNDNSVFLWKEILNVNAIIRAIVLINTTVFFVSTIYILHLYFKERERNETIAMEPPPTIELKSNRRNYIIDLEDISYVEGMGNYINYHMEDNKKIIVYQSLKKCLETLPDNFVRIHKSFIVNTNKVVSYNNESIELSYDRSIPIGNTVDIYELLK